MIEISDRNYHRLVDGHNALAGALHRLVIASEAAASGANGTVNASELAEAMKQAQDVLSRYGDHQGFVLV
ncbi:hypothetical protein ACV229_26570 [Burkholderia sp. MR1-5-21]